MLGKLHGIAPLETAIGKSASACTSVAGAAQASNNSAAGGTNEPPRSCRMASTASARMSLANEGPRSGIGRAGG